ncbi:immunity 53 family protein [Butyrivibrio sp. LB2008]|uniref:immunity 53 family protein n=1 Tax=Butyrivibrio sp. LB2008 TaxID=1408305 RepID=UPI00047E0440|nr:immunity 53 family protein [Butyrivibrio sp. LB2008]
MTNYIKWLENWYKDNCDGYWEHCYGIRIFALDNPGWCVTIDFEDTDLEDKEFPMLRIDNSDDDWIICYVKDKKFIGSGDSDKIEEIIKVFKEWVESNQ